MEPLRLVAFVSSLLIAVTGAALYLLAERLPMNPFVGFRIGYAYISRKLWVKLNKEAGLVLAVIGAFLMPASLILEPLASIMLLLALLVGATIVLVERASRLAEKELLSAPPREAAPGARITPVPPSIGHVAALVAAVVFTIGGLAAYYPMLPDNVAVHFTWSGVPDSYAPKASIPALVLTPFLVLLVLTAFFFILGYRKPEAFYKPWLPWSMITRFVGILYTLLIAVLLVASFANLDLLYYNVYGYHLVPTPIFVTVSLTVTLGLTAYLIAVLVKAYTRLRERYRAP